MSDAKYTPDPQNEDHEIGERPEVLVLGSTVRRVGIEEYTR